MFKLQVVNLTLVAVENVNPGNIYQIHFSRYSIHASINSSNLIAQDDLLQLNYPCYKVTGSVFVCVPKDLANL